jgi:hypothetical protein
MHMADPPSNPDADDDRGVTLDHQPTTSTPRWVKVFGVIALVLLLLLVIALLTGGHGPGRHALPSGVIEHAV